MHAGIFARAALGAAALLVVWQIGALAQTTAPAGKAPPQGAVRQPARSDAGPARSPRMAQAPPREGEPTTGANKTQGGTQAAPAPQAPAGVKLPPPGPRPPFVLTESQQKLLDQILLRWEQKSNKVKTFKCSFTRWESNPTYGKPREDNPDLKLNTEGRGDVKYKSPDHGDYHVAEVKEWDDKKGDFVVDEDKTERWICDGITIYEYNYKNKQLIERRLPPELRGKAISDGPLPFIFGAKVDDLKRRYWMRDVTRKADVGKTVWLEALPKFQADAANFSKVVVILGEKDFMPLGMQLVLPDGKSTTDFSFTDIKVNDTLANIMGDFRPPKLLPSVFWKRVVVDENADAPPAAAPPKSDPAQAKRPAPARK